MRSKTGGLEREHHISKGLAAPQLFQVLTAKIGLNDLDRYIQFYSSYRSYLFSIDLGNLGCPRRDLDNTRPVKPPGFDPT